MRTLNNFFSLRNDSDIQTSQFSKKPCYKNVEAQAGFDGTGELLVCKFNFFIPKRDQFQISPAAPRNITSHTV